MTLTTRTTRKAPWAVALTALLAVLALVFGVLTMAAPATADPPTDPGNSSSAPGQDKVPPGQVDDGTPGASHDKMTICHFVEGKGETKSGYNIITMSVQAWEAHKAHHPSTMDEVYNGVSCPTVDPPDDAYTTTGATAGTTKCTLVGTVWTADYPFTVTVAPKVLTKVDAMFTDAEKTAANLADQAEANVALEEALAAALTAGLIDESGVNCLAPSGATETMTPEAAVAAEAATVAPVLPGTVEEPEAVAVPAPATIPPLPATIPAGDGSGTPTVPTALLALLVLGATALAASTVRLVRTTR